MAQLKLHNFQLKDAIVKCNFEQNLFISLHRKPEMQINT